MKNYICKTTTELPAYIFADVKVPAGLGIYAGEVYVANEIDNSLYENVQNYVPETITDITSQDICIVLNGSFEENKDKRRPAGNPNYGNYKFLGGSIATAIRLDIEGIKIELSVDSLIDGVIPQVGGYLVPVNNSNKLTYVAPGTEITAKNFLKIETLKSFRLGGLYGESFTGTMICRTVKQVPPLHQVTFDVTPTWADIEVYDESGLIYTPISHGIYELPSGNYTYNVSARGYNPITDFAFTVEDEGFEEPVALEISTEYAIVTFNKTPVDMDLTLYLDGDEVIENPDLTYSLAEGEYTYDASAEGYTPVEDVQLNIVADDLGTAIEKSVTLTAI